MRRVCAILAAVAAGLGMVAAIVAATGPATRRRFGSIVES